jgi:hypothetical protein
VQVTGVGDFTKMNIRKGDAGGELDNRGADGTIPALLSFCARVQNLTELVSLQAMETQVLVSITCCMMLGMF